MESKLKRLKVQGNGPCREESQSSGQIGGVRFYITRLTQCLKQHERKPGVVFSTAEGGGRLEGVVDEEGVPGECL